MRNLHIVTPTAEQLPIISRSRPGIQVIRGSAGSGKTTTALLRLRSLTASFVNRNRRKSINKPIRILVVTFNRTLRGYIANLAENQSSVSAEVELNVSTFAKWAKGLLNDPAILLDSDRNGKLRELGSRIDLPIDFVLEEIDYILGRFLPADIRSYLTVRRDGRGLNPRIERASRQRILDEVIAPYQVWKSSRGMVDWNDMAVALATQSTSARYDIVISDETQDFSANEIRAIVNHLADPHSLTLIVDTVQRIYARGFTWQEVGITVRPENTTRLSRNYRNTVEIAKFASPLLVGLPVDDDGTTPDYSTCTRHGEIPIILTGKFSEQTAYAIEYIREKVDLERESVAFLHALGGGWFDFVRRQLRLADLPFVEISRQSEWPDGDENIALSTLYSAKGLEFDHVFILGLNSELTPHGVEEGDDRLSKLRRLLAMGIGRARKSVVVGYKGSEASTLISYFDSETFQEVAV